MLAPLEKEVVEHLGYEYAALCRGRQLSTYQNWSTQEQHAFESWVPYGDAYSCILFVHISDGNESKH